MQEIKQSHQILAKKYRPTNFLELLSQEVLVKILNYSIINSKISQAYLLTGIRGVGKTTTARIIAKTLNCTNTSEQSGIIIPCETCSNCNSINSNNHPDVIEFDAASKTSVDDVRVIIKSSEYKPLLGKYKIFIIDEVHMLSTSAFNALLKILEEPPEHVMFIFATTEVNKIPLTVISRCQRFDLRRFTIKEIFSFIEKIAEKEKLHFEIGALQAIAIKSEGSARDALSLLEQAKILSLESKNIVTSREVEQLFGMAGISNAIDFIKFLIQKDASGAIKLIGEIYQSGANLQLFIISVVDLIAYLIKVKMLNKDYTEESYELYRLEIEQIVHGSTTELLSVFWQIFVNGLEEMKGFYNQLLLSEMLALKAIYSQNILAYQNNQELNIVPNKQIINKSEKNIRDNLTIIDISLEFLRYLHDKKELDLYYFLLNEVEIVKFAYLEINLKTPVVNLNKYKILLQNFLNEWKPGDWKIIITQQENINNLHKELVDKIKSSKEWQKIKENFPLAEISGIMSVV